MPTLQWGLIGPGKIAHKFARDLQVAGGGRLAAVAGRDLGRARAFADQYRVEGAYDSHEALAADPGIDAVYIATPHSHHLEPALACLQAGKAVLCEKPLAANADQARRMAAEAQGRGVFLMEALWTRFLPVYRQVRAWLDEGEIGGVQRVSSTMGFKAPYDPDGRLFNPALAGGSLLDLGIYPISTSQWVTGENPARIAAQARIGETGVDEWLSTRLRYPGGAVAEFATCLLAPLENEMRIEGSLGFIRIHQQFWGATRAELLRDSKSTLADEPFRGGGFEYQIEEVHRCLAAGLTESPAMPLADSIANHEVMDEIRRQIGVVFPFEEKSA